MTLPQLLQLVRVKAEDDRAIVNVVKKSVGRCLR